MSVTLQPVHVETGSSDREGCLVFADGRLAAVLVRLSDQHDDLAGQWFYEHGFGPFDAPAHPVFGNLDAAQDWIRQRLNQTKSAQPAQPPVIGEP
jgi:hypothetical protein